MKSFPKILISLIAIVIAAAHTFLPSVTIDTITLILFVLAVLPWLLPYIKDFEIPGVVKISLPETKAATDKLKDHIIKVKPAQLKITTYPAKVTVTGKKEAPFESLRRLSETEPNLALVGFRIEIEKRIIQLAEIFAIPTDRVSLRGLVGELVKRDVISKSSASGLIELIALGNQAAHGADVTREAAEWVLDVGPSVLTRLEDVEIPKEHDDNA
jgi:hypothetical protein